MMAENSIRVRATVTILAKRVTHARGESRRGDTLSGLEKNLQPLVDCGAAEWADGREDALQVDGTTWDWTVPEATERVADEDDPVLLRSWLIGESRHESYPPDGRVGIRRVIEKRLYELRPEREDQET